MIAGGARAQRDFLGVGEVALEPGEVGFCGGDLRPQGGAGILDGGHRVGESKEDWRTGGLEECGGVKTEWKETRDLAGEKASEVPRRSPRLPRQPELVSTYLGRVTILVLVVYTIITNVVCPSE